MQVTQLRTNLALSRSTYNMPDPAMQDECCENEELLINTAVA